MKRPSFQFYPSDWLRDTALRSCSVGARGLWIDMICFMHEGTPYGHLKVGNKVILPVNLASMVGATLEDVEGWLDELHQANVFDVVDGVFVSRRMIRDEEVRQKRSEGGKLGGNPALKVGRKVNHAVKQNPTPSSSSSSSYSSNKNTSSPDGSEELFAKFWQAYPKKVGKDSARKAFDKRKPDEQMVSEMVRALEIQKQTEQWTKNNGEFVPHPATWLNAGRWMDELPSDTKTLSIFAGAI